MPNTTQIYPLSGETVFADNNAVSFTAPKNGIVYLTGFFVTGSNSLITITKNSKSINFPKFMYSSDSNESLCVNLLSPRIKISTAPTNTSDNTPATATDRNKGAYLPVKAGDQFSFIGSGSTSGTAVIASFYYFD